MRHIVGLVLLVASLGAAATEPVKLEAMKLSGTVATGSCGAAKVSVSGVGAEFVEFSGRVDISSGAHKISLSGEHEPFFLQNRNQVACVESSKGVKLVVVAYCDGRSCNPSEYLVIEPATAKVVSKPDEDGCSLKCAEAAIGGPLPVPLRDGLSNYE